MKKLVSLLLAVVMVMCMSVTAFAAEIETGNNTIDIPASYTGSSITIVGPDGSATATVYSVKLEWTDINGVAYKGAQTAYYWDEASLTYKQHNNSTTAGWTDDSDSCTITVTNKSNAAIKATAEFKAAEDIGATVTCKFGDTNGDTIASAAPTQAQLEAGTVNGSAKTGTITADISASGTLNSGVTSVGTITITIASV